MTGREYRDAIEAELDRAGIGDREFQYGGKHPRVVFVFNGKRCAHGYPSTPSDAVRGLAQNIAALRKQLGLAAPHRRKSTRPTKTKSRALPLPEPPDGLTLRADPLAALKAWRPPPRFAWQQTGGKTWRVEVIREALTEMAHTTAASI